MMLCIVNTIINIKKIGTHDFNSKRDINLWTLGLSYKDLRTSLLNGDEYAPS